MPRRQWSGGCIPLVRPLSHAAIFSCFRFTCTFGIMLRQTTPSSSYCHSMTKHLPVKGKPRVPSSCRRRLCHSPRGTLDSPTLPRTALPRPPEDPDETVYLRAPCAVDMADTGKWQRLPAEFDRHQAKARSFTRPGHSSDSTSRDSDRSSVWGQFTAALHRVNS